jgi:hypothetical protein
MTRDATVEVSEMMWFDNAGWSGWPWMMLTMLLLVALVGLWPLHLLGKWRNDQADVRTARQRARRMSRTATRPQVSKADRADAAAENVQQEAGPARQHPARTDESKR